MSKGERSIAVIVKFFSSRALTGHTSSWHIAVPNISCYTCKRYILRYEEAKRNRLPIRLRANVTMITVPYLSSRLTNAYIGFWPNPAFDIAQQRRGTFLEWLYWARRGGIRGWNFKEECLVLFETKVGYQSTGFVETFTCSLMQLTFTCNLRSISQTRKRNLEFWEWCES